MQTHSQICLYAERNSFFSVFLFTFLRNDRIPFHRLCALLCIENFENTVTANRQTKIQCIFRIARPNKLNSSLARYNNEKKKQCEFSACYLLL